MKVLTTAEAQVYSGDYGVDSIFLAGPTYREERMDPRLTWRAPALKILEDFKYNGEVYVPEPFADDYEKQVRWEDHHLQKAKIIIFWIPRNLDTLPGFTTNVEFGEWMKSGKVILGYPPDTPKMRYLAHKAKQYRIPIANTIESTVHNALIML